jgi:hypothetical protein
MSLFRIVLAGTLMVSPLLSAAQQTDLGRDKSGNLNGGYELVPADSRDLKGSPFLLPYWSPATLRLVGAPAAMPATLKYDVLKQELRARRPQGDSVIVPLGKVQAFTLTGTGAPRRFIGYPTAGLPPELIGTCAEVLADGANIQLLKVWRKVVVKQAGETNGYASARMVTALEDQVGYYLRFPADNRWTAVRLKRTSLEQALVGQPAGLAALKARKGGLSTEADVAATVLALDPLLTTSAH